LIEERKKLNIWSPSSKM
jgi:hypothetical protein